MNRRSIGFRLTLWYAVVLSAALGIFGSLLWFALRERMFSELQEDLEGRAARFEKYFRSEATLESDASLRTELDEFCQALPSGSSMELQGTDGFRFRFTASPPRPEWETRVLEREFSAAGQIYTLRVGAPATEILHTLDLVRALLFGLIPFVIGIASLGGAWLSRRALKPVQQISNAALHIGIENLSERLPVPRTGDELAHLSEVLNTMFARLEAAVKTLAQFAADASHELRTPLAVIQTTADLALRRPRPAESYRQALVEISDEARRMTTTVEDLLALARGDASVVDLPLAPLDVREVVQSLASETRTLAESRGIRLETRLCSEPAGIAGNASALHRLFLALLDNAIKYSPPGREVILSVERDAAQVRVSVRDFGPGIAPGDRPRIFERFYRADRTGTGHGLGLALAQSLAKVHSAPIEVECPAGGGSLFRVTFGAREVPAAEPSANLQNPRLA